MEMEPKPADKGLAMCIATVIRSIAPTKRASLNYVSPSKSSPQTLTRLGFTLGSTTHAPGFARGRVHRFRCRFGCA